MVVTLSSEKQKKNRFFHTGQREMSGGGRFPCIILRGAHPKTFVFQRDRNNVQTVESSFVNVLVSVVFGFQVVVVPPHLTDNTVLWSQKYNTYIYMRVRRTSKFKNRHYPTNEIVTWSVYNRTAFVQKFKKVIKLFVVCTYCYVRNESNAIWLIYSKSNPSK